MDIFSMPCLKFINVSTALFRQMSLSLTMFRNPVMTTPTAFLLKTTIKTNKHKAKTATQTPVTVDQFLWLTRRLMRGWSVGQTAPLLPCKRTVSASPRSGKLWICRIEYNPNLGAYLEEPLIVPMTLTVSILSPKCRIKFFYKINMFF